MREIILYARNFRSSLWSSCNSCAIANRMRELFPDKEIEERVNHVVVDTDVYFHEEYSYRDFYNDKQRALNLGFDDTPICTIKIIEHA